jgi:hypothetical protein
MTRLAYCPPGREMFTAIAFSLAGIHADRILPATWLDSDHVLLVDDGAWNGTPVYLRPPAMPGPRLGG